MTYFSKLNKKSRHFLFWASEYKARKYWDTEEGRRDHEEILVLKNNLIDFYLQDDCPGCRNVINSLRTPEVACTEQDNCPINRTKSIEDRYSGFLRMKKYVRLALRPQGERRNNEELRAYIKYAESYGGESGKLCMLLRKYPYTNIETVCTKTEISCIVNMIKSNFLHITGNNLSILRRNNIGVESATHIDDRNKSEEKDLGHVGGDISLNISTHLCMPAPYILACAYIEILLARERLGFHSICNEDNLLFLLESRIDEYAEESASEYALRSDKSRALGLWLWDYIIENGCSKADAIRAIENDSQIRDFFTEQTSDKVFRKYLEQTELCITQDKVLTMG